MAQTPIGNCVTDNQGNPIPTVGGTCNLGAMHLDASVIDTPEPLMQTVNKSGLDWEFYDLSPSAKAGSSPASQNDFYGNLYSLAEFFSSDAHNPVLPANPDYVVQKVVEKTPCNCNTTKNSPNKMFSKDFLIWGLLAFVIYQTWIKK
jgi:hypothetical protein